MLGYTVQTCLHTRIHESNSGSILGYTSPNRAWHYNGSIRVPTQIDTRIHESKSSSILGCTSQKCISVLRYMNPNRSRYKNRPNQSKLGSLLRYASPIRDLHWNMSPNRPVTSTHEADPVQLPSDIKYFITCKKRQKGSRFAYLPSHLPTKLKALSIEPNRVFWMHEWTRFIAVTVSEEEGRQFVTRTRLEWTGTGKIPYQHCHQDQVRLLDCHSSTDLSPSLLIHCIRNITTHTGRRWIIN